MDYDEQRFNLKWHFHQSSVISSMERMYSTGALTDVTLSANGTNLRAHKLVLASCSQYFAQLFKDIESDNSTLVVVLGCEPSELSMLLSFMYTGEVTASRHMLPSLLKLAKSLKVAGLTDADCTNPITTNELGNRNDEPVSTSPINLEMSKPVQSEIDLDRPDERLSKLDQIVQSLYNTHKIETPVASVPVLNETAEDIQSYDKKYRHSICTICKKRLSNQYNLRVHMETHLGGRHACRACSHVSRSKDALRKHVAYRHPNLAGVRSGERGT